MILEREQLSLSLPVPFPLSPSLEIPSDGHPQRMTHAPTPRPGLDDSTSRADPEFVHDEGDIGQVDDLRTMRQGEGPEGRGGAEEVDEACVGGWGGHLSVVSKGLREFSKEI